MIIEQDGYKFELLEHDEYGICLPPLGSESAKGYYLEAEIVDNKPLWNCDHASEELNETEAKAMKDIVIMINKLRLTIKHA